MYGSYGLGVIGSNGTGIHSCKYIITLVHGLGVGSRLGITPSGIS